MWKRAKGLGRALPQEVGRGKDLVGCEFTTKTEWKDNMENFKAPSYRSHSRHSTWETHGSPRKLRKHFGFHCYMACWTGVKTCLWHLVWIFKMSLQMVCWNSLEQWFKFSTNTGATWIGKQFRLKKEIEDFLRFSNSVAEKLFFQSPSAARNPVKSTPSDAFRNQVLLPVMILACLCFLLGSGVPSSSAQLPEGRKPSNLEVWNSKTTPKKLMFFFF